MAVDYMRPLIERPVSQIVDGIVMTSCTLSAIPSFSVLVIPVLRVPLFPRSNIDMAGHTPNPRLLHQVGGAHSSIHLRTHRTPSPF